MVLNPGSVPPEGDWLHGPGFSANGVMMPLGSFIIPVIDGKIDLGA